MSPTSPQPVPYQSPTSPLSSPRRHSLSQRLSQRRPSLEGVGVFRGPAAPRPFYSFERVTHAYQQRVPSIRFQSDRSVGNVASVIQLWELKELRADEVEDFQPVTEEEEEEEEEEEAEAEAEAEAEEAAGDSGSGHREAAATTRKLPAELWSLSMQVLSLAVYLWFPLLLLSLTRSLS